ncbi:MAG: hypothetical protein NC453_20590 [Muribaculum sp.]|nr:hypothetical protein [Muribaculum sp.]
MEIKIRKAKLAKGGTVEASFIDQDGNDVTLKGKNICHPDLKSAFAGLVPYLADLTEQKEADRIDWDNLDDAATVENLRYLEVTGFSVTDDDVNPMVTLIGKRTLRTSKVLNLCAPATTLNQDTESYERCDDLDAALRACLYEVEQYITERKWQVKQAELNFDNPEDPFAEATPTEDVPLPVGEGVEDVA